MVTLYHLVDLDTWEVLYVGTTRCTPYERLMQHANAAGTPAVRDLFSSRRVGLEEIRTVPDDERESAERDAIGRALQLGQPLVNKLLRGIWRDWTYCPPIP